MLDDSVCVHESWAAGVSAGQGRGGAGALQHSVGAGLYVRRCGVQCGGGVGVRRTFDGGRRSAARYGVSLCSCCGALSYFVERVAWHMVALCFYVNHVGLRMRDNGVGSRCVGKLSVCR